MRIGLSAIGGLISSFCKADLAERYDMTLLNKRVKKIGAECNLRDLWAKENLCSFKEGFTIRINPHGAGLYPFSQ